jgi:hypothetical protein
MQIRVVQGKGSKTATRCWPKLLEELELRALFPLSLLAVSCHRQPRAADERPNRAEDFL